ncbi:hypothetical protein TGAM01_v201511 [Trichoderma gamsii]|uniref:Uncharacterized protein n=1 Tax=Trichoderma gamsii TaxID=398673 RepID=A0A2P4ZY99_9HYPO|nr:hypothetical protein TGAM01_v201511 [Trichoderma gamsii]PON29262.1 hypothetical protein TGAM01_v201511 [Trichoderma gamsii]
MERDRDRAEAEELTAYNDEQQREDQSDEEEEWKDFEDSCVVFPKPKKGVNCDSEVEQTHWLNLLTKLRSSKYLYILLHTEHPPADSEGRYTKRGRFSETYGHLAVASLDASLQSPALPTNSSIPEAQHNRPPAVTWTSYKTSCFRLVCHTLLPSQVVSHRLTVILSPP